MPPAWEKGSHLPPGTAKLGNLRDSHDPSQLPLPNQIFGILLCIEPTQGSQKCDRVQRYARWIGGLSHQSSNLSYPCNPLQKVVICALLDTRFKGMQVVTHPTNSQTTKVMLTKSSQKRFGYMHMDKQGTQLILDKLLLHERHWYSQSKGLVT